MIDSIAAEGDVETVGKRLGYANPAITPKSHVCFRETDDGRQPSD